ncbi:MAG: hypothetical protein M1820_007888 [Bogoriella megaspora]|nr:MAG: hypothetical protein M1820_007888 [Bogoriella megaspora]
MISFFVPQRLVPKYAGLAMSIFSLAQCLTGIPWGRASDRWGRKPTIIVSLFNTLITTILWGFSSSLAMAMVLRAIAGAGNGNVGVIRTAVAELVPWKELQPRAFSIMPLIWNIGSVLGPAIGGALANPLRVKAREGMGLHKEGSLLERFPFALPNLLAAGLFVISILNCVLFMRESLESRRDQYDPGVALGNKITAFFKRQGKQLKNTIRRKESEEEEPLLKSTPSSSTTIVDEENNDHTKEHSPKPNPKVGYRDILTKQSILNLVVYTILATHSLGFDQLIPVYLYQERQDPSDPAVSFPFHFKGGFGVPSQTIGLLLTVYGAFAMLFQFFVFPPLARKYGVLRVYRFVSFMFPIVYLIIPFTALLPSFITAEAQRDHPATSTSSLNSGSFYIPFNVAILFICMLAKCMAAVFAFPCTTILLTNSASSLAVLGTLNGIATSVSAIGRAAGPWIGGNLLGWGVERNVAWLPWWTFAAIAVVGAIASLWLIEEDGFGGDESEIEDSDEEAENEEAQERQLQQGVPAEAGASAVSGADTQPLNSTALLSPSIEEAKHRRDERRLQRKLTASSLGLQDTAIVEEPEEREYEELTTPMMSRAQSQSGFSQPSPSISRRQSQHVLRRKNSKNTVVSSVPIGMGRGISRKLSSNLGQSLGSQHSFGE